MPNVHEYYETDFATSFRFETDWVHHLGKETHSFTVSVLVELIENAKFMAYYFPPAISDANIILKAVREHECFLDKVIA